MENDIADEVYKLDDSLKNLLPSVGQINESMSLKSPNNFIKVRKTEESKI